MIQADVLARYRRAEGYDVRFQAGTDENSLKNVLAAEVAGIDTKTFVGRNAEKFLELGAALNLSVDDFIRTSTEPRHSIDVEKLWLACAANGDVYKRSYTGLYCVGCEQFYKPTELENGRCPEHRTPLEEISEENYFFRLSRYQGELQRAIESGDLKIEPASRRTKCYVSLRRASMILASRAVATEPVGGVSRFPVTQARSFTSGLMLLATTLQRWSTELMARILLGFGLEPQQEST